MFPQKLRRLLAERAAMREAAVAAGDSRACYGPACCGLILPVECFRPGARVCIECEALIRRRTAIRDVDRARADARRAAEKKQARIRRRAAQHEAWEEAARRAAGESPDA